MLRSWRERRRLSQLELSNRAAVSTRHLSYVETGRSRPSRELVLHLAEVLEVPLRERNRLLLAAGHAPHFSERPVDAPELGEVRAALDRVLEAHDPWPAVLVDGHWDVVGMNAGAWLFADGVDPGLLEPPINVMRLSLHPGGLARRLVNHAEFAYHLGLRLRRQFDATADPVLGRLLEEVEPWLPSTGRGHGSAGASAVVLPVVLASPVGELRLFSTIATFGAPLDATLEELALEAFYPADTVTAERLRVLREG
jgi:transcriptional regulator with XRE-family HTH domain